MLQKVEDWKKYLILYFHYFLNNYIAKNNKLANKRKSTLKVHSMFICLETTDSVLFLKHGKFVKVFSDK